MGLVGNLLMYAALASGAFTIVSAALGARNDDAARVRIAERSTYATTALVSAAVLTLQSALVRLDFGLAYVGEYTSSTLSVPYRIGSMWAGMGGSLLLWGWIVSLASAWLVYANKRKALDISSYAYAIAVAFGLLFVGMSLWNSSGGPFDAATKTVADGMGLNPLLQDPLQLIHPLFLYGGYVLFTMPFAVLCGQLLAGRVTGANWIAFARAWAILSWLSLTIGIVLGARWAYAELGWGGYWAWDPVENASLIPWLTGTAVLHLGLAHRGARERLRMRSAIMLLVTFNLCLFGTFLTRSGVIQSVHAFGISNLGPVLGAVILLSALGCGVLLVWRLPELQYRDAALHSRGWFGQTLMTVLLSLMTAAVAWGTLYPLFARAFLGQEIAVTPGFFKVVVTPMGVALLMIFALSPFLKDQKAENVAREAAVRALIFVAVFGATFMLTDFAHPGVAFVIATSVLAVKTVLWKAKRPLGGAMRTTNDRWWNVAHASSPYFGHLGLIIMLAAITLNVSGEVKEQTKLTIGQTANVSGVALKLDTVRVQTYADRAAFEAYLSVLDDKRKASGHIVSKLERFNNSEQLQAQVGIKSSPLRDIYVVVDGASATPGAEWVRITVYNNPFINWIWFGGSLLAVGGICYLLPTYRRRRSATRAGVDGAEDAATGPRFQPRRNTLLGIGAAVLVVAGASAFTANNRTDAAAVAASGTPSGSASATAGVVDPARVAEYMQAINANPNDAAALWKLGNLYFVAQQYANALTFYEKFNLADPEDVNGWIASGAAAFKAGDADKAFTNWTQATTVDPKNVEAHYNLGFWYLTRQPPNARKATTEWQTVLKLAPSSAYAKQVTQQLAQMGEPSAAPSPSK